jgi:hypothetical protein
VKISGFTFVRNAIVYDYPIKECIDTLLSICDEVVVVVSESEDETVSLIKSINNPKLKVIYSIWDENIGSNVLSQQTNIAIDNCSGDWGLYLQSDEVIHEKYYKVIIDSINKSAKDEKIEGLLFDYRHFYGSFKLCHFGRRFYRNEVRAIRLGIGIRSYGDAKGFRKGGRKLYVKRIDAEIYHYGWARHPQKMEQKTYNFHKLWHSNAEFNKVIKKEPGRYNLINNYNLIPFEGTHPYVMSDWIGRNSLWSDANYNIWLESINKKKLFNYLCKVKAFIERKTWFIGYNKPYYKLL